MEASDLVPLSLFSHCFYICYCRLVGAHGLCSTLMKIAINALQTEFRTTLLNRKHQKNDQETHPGSLKAGPTTVDLKFPTKLNKFRNGRFENFMSKSGNEWGFENAKLFPVASQTSVVTTRNRPLGLSQGLYSPYMW